MNTNNFPTLNTTLTNHEDFIECLDEVGLAALPRPTFAIEGFVQAAKTTILCGQTYTGKSIIALDMALCISAGREWNGRPTQKGLAFYITGETLGGVRKRLEAWKKHFDAPHPDHFFLTGDTVLLDDEAQVRRLIANIQQKVQETGVPTRLVVFDSLNKCLGQTDENDAAQVMRVFKMADSICQETGAAVLLVHGTNRQGELLGSGVMLGDPAGLLSLEGKSGSDVVRLKATKMCDFRLGENEMTLRKHLVTMEDLPDQYGKSSTSVVFVRDEGTKTSLAGSHSSLSDKEATTRRALVELYAKFPEGVTSSQWRAAALGLCVPSATFERAKRN